MKKKALQAVSVGLALPGEWSKTGVKLPEQLSFDEWVMVGERLRGVEGSIRWWLGDWIRFGESKYGEKYSQALDQTDKSYQTLRDAVWVAGAFELSRRRDNLSWSHHQEVAGMEPREQDRWLDKAEKQEWSKQELRQALREASQKLRLKEAAITAIGASKHVVILADPPWRYDFSETETREIENQYPTMTVEEICALPVLDTAHEDSMLFLWATNPKLREALAVIEAWGFEYVTGAVWVKDKIGMGYYFRQQHELLLVAKRGNPPAPAPSDRCSSVIKADRGKHSEKPVAVYEIIEELYPGVPKIELFKRGRARSGWDAWGNEAVDETA